VTPDRGRELLAEAVARLCRTGLPAFTLTMADYGYAFRHAVIDEQREPVSEAADPLTDELESVAREAAREALIEIGRAAADRSDVRARQAGLAVLRCLLLHVPSTTRDQPAIMLAVVEHLLTRPQPAALDEAVRLGRDAVQRAPGRHALRPRALLLLGAALRRRYEQTGGTDDLVVALSADREAAELAPADPAARVALACDLLHRHRRTRSIAPLEEAATALRGTGTPEALAVLGDVLLARSTARGELADLAEAVRAYGRAADGQPEHLLALGAAEHTLFIRTGETAYLTRAVRALRAASRSDPLRASALGAALADHFEHTGASPSLAEALALHREAVAARPDRTALIRLGDGLRLRAERHRDPATLDEAIGAYRRALATEAAGPDAAGASRVAAAARLATALRARYAIDGGTAAHLEEAMLLAEEITAGLRDDPDRRRIRAEMGDILRLRAAEPAPEPAAEEQSDLDEPYGVTTRSHRDELDHAIELARGAAAGITVGQPEQARRLTALGFLHAEQYRRTCGRADLHAAIDALDRATQATNSAAMTRIRASRELGRLQMAAGNAMYARLAYTQAVHLLPGLATEELRRDDQEWRLAHFPGLASDAAAAVLAAPDDDKHGDMAAWAFENLEHGRTVLLARELGARGDADADPGEPVNGPVCAINVSDHGCHALLRTGDGVRTIPLPGLTRQSADDHAEAFAIALEITADARYDNGDQWTAARFVERTLEWLWDVVAAPVLTALDIGEPSGQPTRLWWMPTGMLSFLPLHAAGYHRRCSGETVLDRVMSSYTATMRALRPAPLPDPGRGSLVVAVSATAGQAELPGARREAELIARRHPHARVLADADATRANAAALLPDAAWVHFACHAASRVTDPSASCLLLTDGPLTVLDIARMRSPGAYLAYLSACSTARGGTALPDEAIHISSAFQIAGYPHIIATLWPIADDIAADVADDVHARWPADGPARALHDTTRRLRDSYHGRSPHLWAAHIHTGP